MTGRIGFDFEFSQAKPPRRQPAGNKLRVLFVGDFAGMHRPGWLLRKVDAGDLDGLVAAVAPRVPLPEPIAEGSNPVLAFSSLDDFHPDELFRRVEMFHRLSVAPQDFTGAAAGSTQSGDSLLASLLGGNVAPKAPPAKQNADLVIESLLRTAVAPHVTPAASPQQAVAADMLARLQSEAMRQILSAPTFQRVESAWRALERTLTNVPPDSEVEFWLCSLPPGTLIEDLCSHAESLDHTQLAQALALPSTPPFSLVAVDHAFGASIDEVMNLGALAAVVAGAGATLVASADPALLGWVPGPHGTFEQRGVDPALAETWAMLRGSPLAAHVALVFPRLLLRLPYGPRRNEVHAFAFDEVGNKGAPDSTRLLWGGGAFAVAGALATAFADDPNDLPVGDAATLEDIPVFTFVDGQGEKQIYPASELWLSETQAQKALQAGLIPLIAHKDRALATLLRLQSIALPPAPLSVRAVS